MQSNPYPVSVMSKTKKAEFKFERIKKCGIEIEGGWDERPQQNLISDGSVVVSCGYSDGECVSAPLDSWEKAEDFFDKNYPQKTNHTCGIHLHASFSNDHDYATLVDKRFYDFFCDRMAVWGKRWNCKNKQFWNRLEGKNNFCRKRFNPENQLTQTQKYHDARYSHFNFCHAIHGTFEVRLLPTFKEKRIALAAAKEVFAIIEEWLDNSPEEVGFGGVDTVTE